MELPKTEKELRVIAAETMMEFLGQLDTEALQHDRLPIYCLRDVKACGVWVARTAIRKFCPHLAEGGELDLSDAFSEGEDKPL